MGTIYIVIISFMFASGGSGEGRVNGNPPFRSVTECNKALRDIEMQFRRVLESGHGRISEITLRCEPNGEDV